jgi:antitoxin MazE
VKTRIVKIGNSKGVRIPKLILNQLALGKEVELSVRQDHLIIRPSQHPRAGWEAKFKLMAERGDDQLLDKNAANLTQWDADQWQWK